MVNLLKVIEYAIGAIMFGLLIFIIVNAETVKLGRQAQIVINECEKDIVRSTNCILTAIPEKK